MMTGAQAMIKGLKEQGVDIIFGYPGLLYVLFMMNWRSQKMMEE